jgi:hypothetical protein
MYNGFNAQGKFWTDSNGLEMMPRQIFDYTKPVQEYVKILPAGFTYKNVSRNYYPVDSAIAMRDF